MGRIIYVGLQHTSAFRGGSFLYPQTFHDPRGLPLRLYDVGPAPMGFNTPLASLAGPPRNADITAAGGPHMLYDHMSYGI